jgi:RNA-directed DNA polymerase
MYSDGTRAELARCLAGAFLAGPWDERELVARADLALDRSARWAPRIAREVLGAYDRPPSDRPRELAAFVDDALRGHEPIKGEERPPRARTWLIPEPQMGSMPWPVPEIASLGALAGFLGLTAGELAWLADARGLERLTSDERLRNYRYSVLPRRSGLPRVIERPKERLKAVQRRLLHDVLDWIPAHDAAHGFTRGRSALTHARQHTGCEVVMAFDLEDFFASIAAGRIYGIFRVAGYPESVAHALTALTTNAVPPDIHRGLRAPGRSELIDAGYRLGRRLAAPHLPQGAPTSPFLANLAAFRLDRRLSGLASSLDITYSRYADDITISGTARAIRDGSRLRSAIAGIAREEGFVLNDRKSRLATNAGRQQVCGIVVNARLNAPRDEYDRLRAVLHNAARHGPASQNRAGVADFRAHMLGRIAWLEQLNPARGRKLRNAFALIDWSNPG